MITHPLKPMHKRDPATPESFLAKAMDASTPDERIAFAREGLRVVGVEVHPETRMLLLREIYRAHLDTRQLCAARDVAFEMAKVGPLQDIAHHDAARVCFALGEVDDALREQRLALLAAPEDRRTFHAWSLATIEQFAGNFDAALESLERAERWATDDLDLVRAHRTYVLLERGDEVSGDAIESVERALEASRRGRGYGQFLVGVLAAYRGDHAKARAVLEAFVERGEMGSAAKMLTLREELRRARVLLSAMPPAHT
ncbi:MAG: hypothetical protein R3A78_07475 [Polyangiales bacterium]|nr:tetratricopeptide repeat protein [Myxococcales bacterium]